MEEIKEKQIIVGASQFAEIAYEYFTYDSPHEVVAFSVEIEKEFIKLFGLPVVPFEELEMLYDPAKYKVFMAMTTKLLRKWLDLMLGVCSENE